MPCQVKPKDRSHWPRLLARLRRQSPERCLLVCEPWALGGMPIQTLPCVRNWLLLHCSNPCLWPPLGAPWDPLKSEGVRCSKHRYLQGFRHVTPFFLMALLGSLWLGFAPWLKEFRRPPIGTHETDITAIYVMFEGMFLVSISFDWLGFRPRPHRSQYMFQTKVSFANRLSKRAFGEVAGPGYLIIGWLLGLE